ncbi:MAG: hypothetical protein KAV87_06520, partial [Desulfobacteraceae bacterium]|nr:hypothetical protein [Desulfobacteraceae bacterium]
QKREKIRRVGHHADPTGWIKVPWAGTVACPTYCPPNKAVWIHKQLVIRSRIIEPSPFFEFYTPATICAVAFSSSAMVVLTYS